MSSIFLPSPKGHAIQNNVEKAVQTCKRSIMIDNDLNPHELRDTKIYKNNCLN